MLTQNYMYSTHFSDNKIHQVTHTHTNTPTEYVPTLKVQVRMLNIVEIIENNIKQHQVLFDRDRPEKSMVARQHCYQKISNLTENSQKSSIARFFKNFEKQFLFFKYFYQIQLLKFGLIISYFLSKKQHFNLIFDLNL